MSQLTTQQTSGMPAPISCRLSDAVAILSNSLERSADGKRWELPISRLQTPGLRGALELRASELDSGMRRAAPRQAAAVIAAMFLRYPSAANAPDQAARVAAYAQDMGDFPLWAIERACAAPHGQFAPSATQLVETARRFVAPIRKERDELNRLLNADAVADPTPEDRAKVVREIQETISALKQRGDDAPGKANRVPTKAEAEAWLAAREVEPIVLPPLSEEARALSPHAGAAA